MGTITAQSIINDRVIKLLNESASPVRWSQAELLVYLNDGQRKIVELQPAANMFAANMQCAAGPKQTVPSTCAGLIDVVCNMGTSGTTRGNAIRLVLRNTMDEELPGWQASTASAVMKLWMFDSRNPGEFYCYPPQPSSEQGYIEIVGSWSPADVVVSTWSGSNFITLDDCYVDALMNWVLYMAYLKDAEHSANAALAAAYQNAFTQSLGLIAAAGQENTPKVNR